jgi:hypothetical protein
MIASVVGYAMPAATPPNTRAAASTPTLGAHAARRLAGIDSTTPSSSIILRPYRSPNAPRYSTDAASPNENPTATRFSCVCDASNANPMSGRATFATARFRLATAATKINATRTMPRS